MAFNLKNRQPAPPEEDEGIGNLPWDDIPEDTEIDNSPGEGESGESCPDDNPPMPIPDELADPTLLKSNTVATQSWVFRIFMCIWGWTKFFATKSLQVVNDIRASFIKACEVHADRLYTQKLTIIDNNGKPAEVFVHNGKLQINYPFEKVFFYPGSEKSGLKLREFFYKSHDIAKNFIGLNPYEILTNFVNISDVDYEVWKDRRCPFFCVADGEDQIVERTILISCPRTERITGITVLDENQNVLDRFLLPSGSMFRHVTINMPSFKPTGEDVEATRVPLPEEGPNVSYSQIHPFMPPFLKPPLPPCPCIHNGNVPPPPPGMGIPPELNQNIFEEDYLKNDNLFEDFVGESHESGNKIPAKNYDVVYEEYATKIYYNIPMSRKDFTVNRKQFLFVETMKV